MLIEWKTEDCPDYNELVITVVEEKKRTKRHFLENPPNYMGQSEDEVLEEQASG